MNAHGYDPTPYRPSTERQKRRAEWCRSLGWQGSFAITPTDGGVCPECGAGLTTTTIHQDALFRHGGYGATRTTHLVTCPGCSWATVPAVSETRPPR